MILLLTLNWMMSMLIIFFKTPLSKGLVLMALTIINSLITSTMYLSSWFGYMLFLIMVGGILVTFIYMTSIASNEKLTFPKMKLVLSMMLISLIIIVVMYKMTNWMPSEASMMLSYDSMSNSKMYLTKIFSSPNNIIPLAVMSYLFLTLIMVVKMTDLVKGPIRQK